MSKPWAPDQMRDSGPRACRFKRWQGTRTSGPVRFVLVFVLSVAPLCTIAVWASNSETMRLSQLVMAFFVFVLISLALGSAVWILGERYYKDLVEISE